MRCNRSTAALVTILFLGVIAIASLYLSKFADGEGRVQYLGVVTAVVALLVPSPLSKLGQPDQVEVVNSPSAPVAVEQVEV